MKPRGGLERGSTEMKRDVAIRGVPPRTMADVSRELVRGGRGAVRHDVPRPGRTDFVSVPVSPVNTRRQWRYQTRPSFKRVRGPLVDVFDEAEEVLIVVDLGGFTRGDISLIMSPQHYILQAVRGEQRFSEVVGLPPNVDTERSRERFVNGVLEIVLPRKKIPIQPRSVSEKREHAPSRPASPARNARDSTDALARSALLGARSALLRRAPRRRHTTPGR